jgi:Soluble lytic murein transglycosylase and related regulatory proteins (some contain LysM/invasin domains)
MAGSICPLSHAAEHVTLKNGFELDCVRREIVGDRVRLYPSLDAANYLEVAADAVMRVEAIADLRVSVEVPTAVAMIASNPSAEPTREEIHTMLAHAGTDHNIDADLLASVVRAESGGRVRAVSHAGARGLMQLMPGTASELGVEDTFRADQNVAGGTAYLDHLLVRYHDNVVLALAAYNAGPAAVDRYHGIPPYRETRAYVARVIREFNRRKLMARVGEQVAQAK